MEGVIHTDGKVNTPEGLSLEYDDVNIADPSTVRNDDDLDTTDGRDNGHQRHTARSLTDLTSEVIRCVTIVIIVLLGR